MVKNTIFMEITFADYLLLRRQRMPCSQISWKKLADSNKTAKFAKIFLPQKFPTVRYVLLLVINYIVKLVWVWDQWIAMFPSQTYVSCILKQ